MFLFVTGVCLFFFHFQWTKFLLLWKKCYISMMSNLIQFFFLILPPSQSKWKIMCVIQLFLSATVIRSVWCYQVNRSICMSCWIKSFFIFILSVFFSLCFSSNVNQKAHDFNYLVQKYVNSIKWAIFVIGIKTIKNLGIFKCEINLFHPPHRFRHKFRFLH